MVGGAGLQDAGWASFSGREWPVVYELLALRGSNGVAMSGDGFAVGPWR